MMSDKDKNIIQDDFSQKIKEKLENYSMPVDEDIWLEIEKKLMPQKQKKSVPLWYWLSGGVAAAVLVLLLLLTPFGTKDNQDLITAKTTTTDQQDTTNSNDNQLVENDLPETFVGAGQAKTRPSIVGVQKPPHSGLAFVGKDIYKEPIQEKTELTEILKPTTDTISESIVEKSEESNLAKQEVGTTTPESNKKIDVLPDLNDYPEVVTPSKTRKKRPLLLAMSMETSDGLNMQSAKDFSEPPIYSAATLKSRTLVSKELAAKYNSVLNVSDFTQSRHLPPLSFGLTVAMPLNERFAVETGLVYTYLRSEFTKPGITAYKANLHLHYLGIPLNLRVKLWNKPTWNIYFSAGGMGEKGLRSYNQEIDSERGTLDTEIKSIDGLQWSLSSGLGIDVKIQRRLSFFAEPKLIYYLENNQPYSARTENPLYIGVNGGFRIEL